MPSTAKDMVAAARMCFGRPKDKRATELMKRWLDGGCRDWRRESTEDEETVVSAVFAEPIEAQKLRVQIAKNVDRWGFLRRGHKKEHLQFLTVDEYMQHDLGELVLKRARELIQRGVQMHEDRMDLIARTRKERFEEKLAAFKAKQRQRHAPVLKLCLKSLWDEAGNTVRKKLAGKPFREDPVARRRRMSRAVEYDRLDEYTAEGEPDWGVKDKKRRLQVTVEM